MRILQQKKLYLPAFSIVGVVFFLLVVIGISTYRNLDRDKRRVMSFVHRQGLSLLGAIEAGTRTGIMMHIQQDDTVANLIREVAKNEDVAYIYLFNTKRRIVHHTDISKEGRITTWNPGAFEEGWVYSRMNQLPDNTNVYEVAKFFSPIQSVRQMPHHKNMMPRIPLELSHQHAGDIIVLGLKMKVYEEAQRSDLHHAVIMAAIVVVLGSGVFFFFFVIQNYYLVGRTLRHTQDYARQVVNNMASGVLSVDRQGELISYNQVAIDLLGLEQMMVNRINLKMTLDFLSTGIQEVFDRCHTMPYKEIEYQKKQNETVPLGISVSPIRGDDGTCNEAVLIVRDLREIKQLEEKVRRSEKLAAVGQLAAGLAHEIRNPLSSIRGFAQFLRHALKDKPKEQEYTEIMIKEMDRINRVVSDLLSFANPRAAEPAPASADELVRHVVQLVEADAQSKDITIERHIDADIGEIYLDAYQITQAFLNLLLNSLKFVEKGGRIEVKALLMEQGTEFVFQVEDNGPGILPENMTKIFDPFFTTRESGTGLGLAIVHKIVENHHGDIDVESPPSGKTKGCRFTVRIPMNLKTP